MIAINYTTSVVAKILFVFMDVSDAGELHYGVKRLQTMCNVLQIIVYYQCKK